MHFSLRVCRSSLIRCCCPVLSRGAAEWTCTSSQILPVKTETSNLESWEAGKNYIYKIVTNGDELYIKGSVSITDWGKSDGGSVEVN